MRILRVAQKLYPDVPGGGAYHAHAMSRDQAAMGHDVTVLTVRRDGAPRREERDGYSVERFPATASPLGNEVSFGLVRRLLGGDRRPDVVHAHSHLYFATNVASFARRIDGAPLAITNHGLYSQSAPERLFGAYVRTLGRWTFEGADLVFCYSDADAERLRDVGVSTETAVVPNGIEVDRFSPDGGTSDAVDKEVPAVLFVGRLAEGKRPGDAVRALAHLRSALPEARLYVVGTGERAPGLSALADDLGLSGAVEFLGQVDYEAMPGLYRAADVLILPSRAEGMPRTVLEAMATATPVVTSDLPQLREVVDGAGLTAPVGDVPALAAALESVFTDAVRAAELGRRGRERVAEEHAWATTVERTTARLSALSR